MPQCKTAAMVDGTNIPKASSLELPNESGNINPYPEKSGQETSDDQYPRGSKRILLAGASIVAVFLIALDQVRSSLDVA